MLNDRLAAANELAAHLFALEEAIDEAVSKAGALTCALPAARTRARVAASVGQDAFAEVAAGVARLVEARQHIVQAHEVLADARDQLGIRTTAGGSLHKLLPKARKHLAVVDEAA